jgi:phosphoglycolate phosphatase
LPQELKARFTGRGLIARKHIGGNKLYKTIIFDFDGTIADSEQTVDKILEGLAERYKFDNLSPKEFKHKAGLPLLKKVRMLFFVRKVELEFKKLYGENISSIKAFDNMINILTRLHGAGYQLAVISSNTRPNIEKFLRLNGVSLDIPVLGSKGLFGKHKAIRAFIESSLCTSRDVLYVGDEIRDIKACKKAGVDIAFVKWGLDGDEDVGYLKPEYCVSTPEELGNILFEH